ncbi:MAG: hypothetical protein RMN51_09840 [Verrucomicrobiota bacterium]|nr:hypothetical protein [Limisphaera sp.]MDW8382392.1 hypothetical protein [Verrucomicrobiota bacterium]
MHYISALFAAVILATGTVSAQLGNIAWVSFHAGDNSPSSGAQGAGFTQAPDVGYTQLLTANGYNVTRFVTQDNMTPTSPLIQTLNTFDLVIISRSVPSGHYQSATENQAWHGISKPMMILGGYVIRGGGGGGARLGFMTGENIPDTAGTIRLQVNDPNHPIFQGIALDANNLMVNNYAQIVTVSGNPQRGISVVTNPPVSGATILATVGTTGDPAYGGMVIGEFPAGTMVGPLSGGVPTVPLAGRRLIFLTGSREAANVNSETAGIYDLIGDGPQLFLNAVAYMIPEPNAAALLLLGGLPLWLRRRR